MVSGYYDTVNPELLAMMPLAARSVLEIGCGSGALAARWRAMNPSAAYTGVEISSDVAARASRVIDRVIAADIETLADDEIAASGSLDLIVMGDTLEHLREPERMLARAHHWLAPGGHLLLSVPNVAHWSALAALIRGDWPRRDSGLFDRTHLAFFTPATLLAALRGAGFIPLRMRARNHLPDPAEAERWIAPLAELAGRMGQDVTAFRARAEALQHVVIAVRPGAADAPATPEQGGATGPEISPDADGTARLQPLRLHQVVLVPRFMEVRTRVPARAMASDPLLVVSQSVQSFAVPANVDLPRVVVVQRPRMAERSRLLDQAAAYLAAGWVTVIEYDDDPRLIARIRGEDDVADRYFQTAALGHAVQTSTPALGRLFQQVSPEVAVFPNAVAELAPTRPLRTGPARVVYGALNRPGAADIAAALAPAIDDHPQTHFDVIQDRRFFDALPTARKTLLPHQSYDDYLALLSRADIVLSPLDGRPEELAKSDVKWVEAASRGAVMIASAPVYAASIRHGETGLIAAGLNDWATLLSQVLADPGWQAAMAAAARDEIAGTGGAGGRMIAHQVASRRDWYRSLWARRASLTEGVLARNPDLAIRVRAHRG